jgi:hypothetical protein
MRDRTTSFTLLRNALRPAKRHEAFTLFCYTSPERLCTEIQHLHEDRPDKFEAKPSPAAVVSVQYSGRLPLQPYCIR